jgi:predicted DCC family thiol-disulfide oxidoreductase YuxK
MMLPAFIEGFFFRRITAKGFGLMRISWAFFAGAYMLMQWKDVTYYYSEAGIMPDALEKLFLRQEYRFTILDWVTTPESVFALYLAFLVSLFCMMIGLWPRLMTIISVLLMYSFQERNMMILNGGDTLMRLMGFIMMISPGIDAFSVSRLRTQWLQWKKTRTFLPPPTMPIWPWRMLLWQMIVLYATSTWHKVMGVMWINGTAVAATFHHPVFARWPMWFMNMLVPFTSIGDYLAVLWQSAWVLLLVPRAAIEKILPRSVRRIPLRRFLIVGGILFHGGILVLLDAGIFSLAIYTAYFGLLLDEDFAWMKKTAGTFHKPVVILFDGHCGLCLRSIFTLQMLDWLGILQYANFRDNDVRKKEAPDVTLGSLDKAMHIRLSDGTYLNGFDAARRLAWHLPPLWIAIPFLYIPGVAPIGRRIYAKIADSRKKCDHEGCAL